MSEEAIPSLSSGNVGSRFVTENEISSARAKRDEEWREAYARLGQAPPPRPVEDVYDGRSLAEKLAANKVAKQEEWEERNKLSNQFRALEEDEVQFLDTMAEERRELERKRKLEEAEDLRDFRRAIASRSQQHTATGPSPEREAETLSTSPSTARQPAPRKKMSLKGVQVRRKPAAIKPSGLGGAVSKRARTEAAEGDLQRKS